MVKPDLFPELGGIMTKQQFRDYVYAESRVSDLNVWVMGITAEPNRVAVEAVSDMSVGEHVYPNVYHWLFEIKNGKAIAARYYFDTQLAQKFVQWLGEAGANMNTRDAKSDPKVFGAFDVLGGTDAQQNNWIMAVTYVKAKTDMRV